MLFNLFTPSYPVVDVNIPEGWWKSDSQLDIDFANNRAFNSKTAYKGRPSELLTYTSPSPKMVFSESGILKYARHNLLTYSEDFSNAAWTKQNVSLTSAIGPLNNVSGSATLVVPSAVSGEHYFNASPTLVSRRFYTFSCYVKAAGYNYLSLSIGASRAWATFDLTDGTVSATSSNGTDFSTESATIISIGNGWYRVSITALCLIGTSYVLMSVISNTDLTVSYTTTFTGDGVSGIIYAGCQLQSGVHSFDYLATTSAAKYDLPIDYHPTTHAPLGVLIEEQRTNLLTYSQEFDNAAWTKSRATVTANATTAPDGTTTADKLIPSVDNNTHRIYQGGITHGVLRTYAFTCYLKAGEYTLARLALTDVIEADAAHCTFNLSAGTIGTPTHSGTFSASSANIEDCGDGWYRCTLIATCDATEATVAGWVASGNASGGLSFAGDGTSGIYVWGAQLEAGAFASSYIQTGSAQVTRAADQVTLATNLFNFVDATGTIFTEASTVFTTAAVRSTMLFTNGGADYMYQYFYPNRGGFNVVDTTTQADIAPASGLVDNTMYKQVAAWAVNDMAAVVNGGTVATDVSGTMPSGMTTLRIGAINTGGGYALSRPLKRLTYWNTRKSNAELQGLSA